MNFTNIRNITVMENHLVVLLLSVCVLLGAFYVNTIEQRIIQIKDELHGNEIKRAKEELESTRKAFTELKVELESTTRNVLKQAEVESGSTKEQINILRKEMIEKDYARREEIFKMRPDINALREELNEKDKGEPPISLYTAFTATLSSQGITLSQGEIVKYSRVLANIGNCYDSATGVFTVKTSGVYSVSASMMTPPNKSSHLMLMKNGQILVWLYTGGPYDMASQTINVALSGGDKLWIQQNSGSQLHGSDFYNLFTAALIKPGTF